MSSLTVPYCLSVRTVHVAEPDAPSKEPWGDEEGSALHPSPSKYLYNKPAEYKGKPNFLRLFVKSKNPRYTEYHIQEELTAEVVECTP